jgi:hypothetical protein
MDCSKFENIISDYLDSLLDKNESLAFLQHSLECRTCRGLLDQVKSALNECRHSRDIESSGELDVLLEAIPQSEAPLGCLAYRELITEFLDGFVPATLYHRFEQHAAQCETCSELLTDVVYAVAACHGVHSYEDYNVPPALVERLRELSGSTLSPLQRKSLAATIARRFRSLADRTIPAAAPRPRRSFGMGVSLLAFTFFFLLLGFSDDGTVPGIYRQAHVEATDLFNRGTRAYVKTDKLVAEIQEVRSNLGEIWGALSGDSARQSDSESGKPEQAPRPPGN